MIKIAHQNIETTMELNSCSPLVLSVENSKEFYNFIIQLEEAFSEKASAFSFWNGDELISPEKIGEIIINPFCFDAADKKIINLLYKKLQCNYNDGTFILRFNEISASIEEFLYELCASVDFAIEHQAMALEDLLKICSVKPVKNHVNLLEKLICYVNIFAELKRVSFFVLVGFKDVLTNEELILLYRHCALNKISLFLVERRTEKRIENERKIIITEDLCEIVENIPQIC